MHELQFPQVTQVHPALWFKLQLTQRHFPKIDNQKEGTGQKDESAANK